MTTGTLTQSDFDSLYERILENTAKTRGGKPVFTLIASRGTYARIEQAWLRSIKRRARKKAKTRS